VRFGPVRDRPVLDAVPICSPPRIPSLKCTTTKERERKFRFYDSLSPLSLSAAACLKVNVCIDADRQASAYSLHLFSLDSPYLVGEMHCTVKKKRKERHSIVESRAEWLDTARVLRYSPMTEGMFMCISIFIYLF